MIPHVPSPRPTRSALAFRRGLLLLGVLAISWQPVQATPLGGASARLTEALSEIPASAVPSGILYDRVLSLSDPSRFDGSALAPAASPVEWRQLYDEMRRASSKMPNWPEPSELARRTQLGGALPTLQLSLLDVDYERLPKDAFDSGRLTRHGPKLHWISAEPLPSARAIAASVLSGPSYRGGELRFVLPRDRYFTNRAGEPRRLELDAGDGLGFRPLSFDAPLVVRYGTIGEKELTLRYLDAAGAPRQARFPLEVRALSAPLPNDTLHITASITYGGQHGTGDAYVYLAPGHGSLERPAVVLEGFDFDNSMNWDELYALLNRENLLETLRARGFDAVVLNFTNAVDYIQRNGMVAIELVQQIEAVIPPSQHYALAGASMGGLVGRYALAYMENHALPHRVSTFVSFDSPQKGANIPLGIQYWLAFFAGDSPEAAAFLAALDTPGARQMLAYHHTDPPTGSGQADPLRVQFLQDLTTVGGYPSLPRLVAIANGTGDRDNQGFGAGQQIISWNYTSFLVDITGDVWAVPGGSSHVIFHGLIDFIFLPADEQTVTVSGTLPYDNAPGGWRDSMADMDAVPAPYGDIVALFPNHDFIPSVSSLAVDTGDLFYDIASDPNLLAKTPFDAVYYPTVNEEHVAITPANAAWLLAEIEAAAASIEIPGSAPGLLASGTPRLDLISAHPVSDRAELRLDLPIAGEWDLALVDASGRLVSSLAPRTRTAGISFVTWARPASLANGVYFLRLSRPGLSVSRRLVLE